MARQARKPPPTLLQRTPVAEWTAAALGLIATLAVVGYSLWEGLTSNDAPPSLAVRAERAREGASGFTVPIVVSNSSHRTAAQVEVVGVLEGGGPAEERSVVFTYVPGRGEARGGLVFSRSPVGANLKLSAEGYEDP